ncbi:MAG: PQQ-binding-like beta-propeller repeat protein [Planctomycetota bacterium]
MLGPQFLSQIALNQKGGQSDITVEPEFLDNPQTVLNSKLLGPLVGTSLLLLWWLAFSKAPWQSRLSLPIVSAGLAWPAWKLMDDTMVFAFFMFTIPTGTTGGIITLALFRKVRFLNRSIVAIATFSVTLLFWSQLRMQGVDGDLNSEFVWRWGSTDEEIFLSGLSRSYDVSELALEIRTSPQDCPEFRGRSRDGSLRGVSIRSDWPQAGLPEVWRRRIGPGWSSFIVIGDWLFTQEQRADQEMVSAYDARTGEERWCFGDANRFKESISGVGPRATPTFSEGRLFTTGPSGTVQCLESTTGTQIWRRSLVDDTGADVPMWGFSSSPLVYGDNVVVFSGAGPGKSLVSYDRETGEMRWSAGRGYLSYSSPHLVVLHDVPQILMMTEQGIASYVPETGEMLWEHGWELGGGAARIVQPATVGNDILIGTGYGLGTTRVSVLFEGDQWNTEERWKSRALKPYFNDFVVANNYLYGFDKNIFTCVDLDTGNRMWKRGRFGHGQVVLIEDDNLLLILSESGELVLLKVNSEELDLLHRFPALNGKTWSHPVIANGRLYVRNSVEAACFDISVRTNLEVSH